MKKLAVFVSGTGSLLEAILGDGLSVGLVLADRQCRAVGIAKAANVPVEVLERSFGPGFNRREYTIEVIKALVRWEIDLVAMAGYMTVLDGVIFEYYPGKILNTHPSLLPQFKGAQAVGDTLAAGARVTGCTVHIATAKLDSGEILAQEEVLVLPGDTETTLHGRIKEVERRLYPAVIRRFARMIE
jgi:phosphoribosylglycinamide formyltransferase-1